MSLQRRAALRHLARHPWQVVLSVAGVALGVAVVVSMDLAIESSREAFRVSAGTVAGHATHQAIGGVGGLPDSLVARLRIDVGIRGAAPVVDGYVISSLAAERPLRLLGVDPFLEGPFRPWLEGSPGGAVDGALLLAEPGATFIGRETARRLGVDVGDAIPIEAGGAASELTIVGVLDPADAWSRTGLRDLLIVDISEAQDALGRDGRVDRIDLRLPEVAGAGRGAGARAAEGGAPLPEPPPVPMLEAVERLLPPDARVEAAGTGTDRMREMTRAFDVNLRALSLLGLILGAFLIYNTMAFSVLQRRETIGVLRSLGVTRGESMRGVLLEAAALGTAGAAIGLLAGIVLGRGLVRMVTRTINDLYFVVSVEGLSLPPEVLLRGGLLGIGMAVLAALPAAWEAGSVSPREAASRSRIEEGARRMIPRVAMAGALVVAAGTGLLFVPAVGVEAAFAGLFAVVLGLALLVPGAIVVIVSALRPLLRRAAGVVGAMAARGTVTSLSRTAPAASALVVAIAVVVGLGTMIGSFRGSVVDWLDTTLQADLHVSTPSVVAGRPEGALPGGLAEAARAVPGVAGVSTYRSTEVRTGQGLTRVLAVDLDPRGESGVDLLARVEGVDDIFRAFRAGEGILASEPFALRHGIVPGRRVVLEGESGSFERPVLGIVRDYGSQMGTLTLSRALYDAHWTDPAVTSLGIFLDGTPTEEVEAQLRAAAGERSALVIRSTSELQARSIEVFDRTFAVTRVLQLLAFGVAFIAVLSALMALQLERTREFGILRATGMTPRQAWGLITARTALLGLVSGLLALPVGGVLAVIMIRVVNRRSFGWTLDMEISIGLLAQAVGLALAGALLAGLYPAWRLSRVSPARALRGE